MPKHQLPAEKYPRRSHPPPPEKSCGPAHTPPTPSQEAGGRGKGQTHPRDSIPYQAANRLPVSNQRLPETGWLTSAGMVTARNQLPRRHTWPARGNWGWARGGDKAHRTRGEGARQAPAAWAARKGKAQNAGPTEAAPLWRTRKLAPHATRGPLPGERPGARAVQTGKHMRRERGQTSVAGTLRVLPTHAGDICLQRPSLPAARLNKQPKQETTSAHLDTEETCRQKPNKQREPLQKWQVQQDKISVVNTDYTGRSL